MSEIEEETQVPKTKVEPGELELYKVIKDKIVGVDDTESFTISFTLPAERKLKAELCIYRVPEKLRKVKEDAYSPRVVAIGPFHRDKTTLASMSDHKLSYTASFLAQYTTEDQKEAAARLKACIAAIRELDAAIRHCYIEKMKTEITADKLAEMMLVDGCFILELFLRTHLKFDYMRKHQYESDPVLRSPWTMAAIRHDLALLENQIPFFILEILYGFICPIVKKRCKAPRSVSSLALSFFKPMSRKEIREEAPDTESKHLLDLLHKFYFPPVPAASVLSTNGNDIESNINPKRKRNGRLAKKKWGFGYCASELMESGIEFRMGPSSEESLLNITFNQPRKDGVINIPQLRIHDTTSISLFRNLIAFEQCSLSTKQSITSYAFLMKSLISSSLDSKLLERRGIIEHSSNGEKEYLANKFRSILDGVDLMDDFCFREVCDRVNEYQKSWNNPNRRLKVFFRKQRRILWANYLSSAWKVMSILAAVTILIFTSLQTYYTIHPRN
ncbi:hypothetical protein ACLB2K_056851 [Fragaria x ananassa]